MYDSTNISTISSCVAIGGAHDIKMEEPAEAIAPVGVPKLLALCHVSEIQVPVVKVPLLQATDITNGYFPLLEELLMCVLL